MTYRILAFDSVASTNDEAMARLKAGERGGFIVTARIQTGGRGRQGRAWSSPPGNLYASLGLRDPAPVQLSPQLGFVAGVALAKALRIRLAGDARLKIKWPNDMVFSGAKLAGILLECAQLESVSIGCVVGFGVNCLTHPDDLPYPATDLHTAGDPAPSPDAVLKILAEVMVEQLGIWDRGANFPEIRAAWLDLAAGLGQTVTVTTPSRTFAGIFRDLDAHGRLLVECSGMLTSVEAGDVFLADSASRVQRQAAV